MIKLGYSLVFLILISMVIPASAQNISDEDLKIREEIRACFNEVDANNDLTAAEKTVAKRDCETSINNKYSKMNNNHRDLAEERNRIQTVQKCEDWYSSYKLLDEEHWRVQKHAEHATDCITLYSDDIWNYSGDNRLIVLADRLLEIKAEQIKRIPTATSIELPSESSTTANDNRYDKMAELEAKVAQLQNEIQKKDQVIREQIKVITNLANMIKNVMFGVFLPNIISF